MVGLTDIITVLRQTYPPKSTFSIDDIQDLSGKVVLVTGANTGIGKETARVLLKKNAKVYVACRDQTKAEDAVRELKEKTGQTAIFHKLNLGNLREVKKSAEEFLSKETELHILINNAGVMNCPVELITDDGYDFQFGTNVLGHFYFTKLLLPLLLSTAKTAPKGAVRVVNLSSVGHLFGRLEMGALKDSPQRRGKSTMELYGQSKSGNIMFATELKRRYGDQGIVSCSLHPGGIKTDLNRYAPPFQVKIANLMLNDVSLGALTQLYAATTPDASAIDGKYLIPWARIGTPRPDTVDPKLTQQLWDWMEEQVKDL